MWKKSVSTILIFLFTVLPIHPLLAMDRATDSHSDKGVSYFENMRSFMANLLQTQRKDGQSGNIDKLDPEAGSTDGRYVLMEDILEDEYDKYFWVNKGRADEYKFITAKAFLNQDSYLVYPTLVFAVFFELMHRGVQASGVVLRGVALFLGIGLTPQQIYEIMRALIILSSFASTGLMTARESIKELKTALGMNNGTVFSSVESAQGTDIDLLMGGNIGIHQELPEGPSWQNIPNISLPKLNISVPLPPIPQISVPTPTQLPPTIFPVPTVPVSISVPVPIPTIDTSFLQEQFDKLRAEYEEKINVLISAANQQGSGIVASTRELLPPLDIEQELNVRVQFQRNNSFSLGFGSKNQSSLLGDLDIGSWVRAILPDDAVNGAITFSTTVGCYLVIERFCLAYVPYVYRPHFTEEFLRNYFGFLFASKDDEESRHYEFLEKALELVKNPFFSSFGIALRFVGMHLIIRYATALELNKLNDLYLQYRYDSPGANGSNSSLYNININEKFAFPQGQFYINGTNVGNSTIDAQSVFGFTVFVGLTGFLQLGQAELLLGLGAGMFSLGVLIWLLEFYNLHHPQRV